MVLDTNALSAVADNISAVMQVFVNAHTVELPVIVLGEDRFGIARSLRRDNYEQWLTKLIASSRVLDMNEHTTRNYAHVRLELKKMGRPIPSNDLWIVALSRQHSLPILSRDRHFDGISGVARISW